MTDAISRTNLFSTFDIFTEIIRLDSSLAAKYPTRKIVQYDPDGRRFPAYPYMEIEDPVVDTNFTTLREVVDFGGSVRIAIYHLYHARSKVLADMNYLAAVIHDKKDNFQTYGLDDIEVVMGSITPQIRNNKKVVVAELTVNYTTDQDMET